MPLTASQRILIFQSFIGLRAAMKLQMQLADYSHDRIATEYLITTKVAESLLELYPGKVDVERKTREIFNIINAGKGFGRKAHSGIRSGRIDAVVSTDTSKLLPAYFVELKIRVISFGSIKKDLERFAAIIRRLDASKTRDVLGASVFPFTAQGLNIQDINRRLIAFLKQLRQQVRIFAAAQTGVVVRLHIDKGTLVNPQSEMLETEDGTSVEVGCSPGYRTIGVAVTVARI